MDKAAVLLLERNATIIDVARACLAGDDVELHVANSVELAVRIAARRPPVVAVLDVTMAGAVPGETVMRLKARSPALRIVFLADPGVVVDRRHSQLGMVLRKPFTAERFGDTVRSALRLQSMSAGVQRMRHSSGTYAAISMSEAPPEDAAARPFRHWTPPIPREEPDEPPRKPTPRPFERVNERDEPPRTMTPRPFERVNEPDEPPRTMTPRPFARVR